MNSASKPTFLTGTHFNFPNPEQALKEPNGLLAVGGDLSVNTLVQAYKHGIFPWYNADQPILWWSPNPRAVLFFDELRVSKSLAKFLGKKSLIATHDKAFKEVIKACAEPRSYSDSTWIQPEMIESYCQLFKLGIAHSIEIWQEKALVGGIYGLSINKVFCGESMFSRVSNASKMALVELIQWLKQKNYKLLDCQIMNAHLASLGAREISRKEYLKILHV